MLSLSRRIDRRWLNKGKLPLVGLFLFPLTGIACQPAESVPPSTPTVVAPAHESGETVKVDAASDGHKWSGWGCSLSWWANRFGERDDLADAIFTTKPGVSVQAAAGTYSVPGLGLNVVRYNVGGTGEDTDRAVTAQPNNPSGFPAFKRIHGFWRDWKSKDPASPSWDWSRDANQRAMLLKAKQRGANVFEAFSTAPMWWMTINKSSAGGKDGRDNLQSWNQIDHARYLATVVRFAADKWGIPFQTVSPFNEPSAPWWKYPGGQEGCHFDRASQSAVIGMLRKELDSRGLNSVRIAASDENAMDDALSTWGALSDPARGAVGQVNVHGYSGLNPYRGPNRGRLSDVVRSSGKDISMSEYGDPDASGAALATSILRDLKELRPNNWVYWQPFDGSHWGLIDADPGKGWIGSAGRKWYVMAQFSRHLRPGVTFLPCSSEESVAAYDASAHKLIIVMVNTGSNHQLNFDLSGFKTVSGPVSSWRTDISSPAGGQQYQSQGDIPLQGTTLRVSSPANSVQTFEIAGVDIKSG